MRAFFTEYLEAVGYCVYLLTLFLHYQSCRKTSYLMLFCYYLVATIVLLESSLFIHSANNWNYNLLLLITPIILSLYFRQLFRSSQNKQITFFGIYINLVVSIYFDVLKDGFFTSFNSYVYATCFLTIVIYALVYFYELLQNVKEHNILNDFDFWLVCGYLFYFLGSFCIILYFEGATASHRGDIWIFQNLILFSSAVITLKGHLRFSKNKLPSGE